MTEEYYARDINYQQEYDRRQNSNDLQKGVRLEKIADQYRVVFPEGRATSTKGTLLFYRPSSKLHDRLVKIKVDEAGGMTLSLAGLEPGQYRAILELSAAGKVYWDEFTLTV